MGLSGFRAISGYGLDGYGLDGNLCAGLFYEHRFAMLIITGPVLILKYFFSMFWNPLEKTKQLKQRKFLRYQAAESAK